MFEVLYSHGCLRGEGMPGGEGELKDWDQGIRCKFYIKNEISHFSSIWFDYSMKSYRSS